ncbi:MULTISPECIES: hypothetical protein [Amycolatopsis]|uniref:Uncharacterized protein n=2 Tax=Amycolatopsis roodepoortensis TaxID=700274 RepID=A0ABR9L2T9_9PSEU|nr:MULTISPECIES: hypothetical protein [Amycolatopsis]MBE1575048.1 hypothetical protein [Amycolatopsis roodepoortensis]GHG97298.1 hypothetical protein GCM10017788_76710 [Amycolatopsis acidiphila]
MTEQADTRTCAFPGDHEHDHEMCIDTLAERVAHDHGPALVEHAERGHTRPLAAAAQLRAIAGEMPYHEQQDVANQLEQLGARVSGSLGSDHPGSQRIQEAINDAMKSSSDTYAALERVAQAANEVADNLMR